MNRLLFTAALTITTLFPRLTATAESKPNTVTNIGSRLELMVDEHLIQNMNGEAHLKLHKPVMRNVAIVADQPWEGNSGTYWTFFKDGDLYRAYYGCIQVDPDKEKFTVPHAPYLCYAESKDGIHWTKPELGIVEFAGSKKNNILLGYGALGKIQVKNLVPDHVNVFKDTRPNCPADERYKAVVRAQRPDSVVGFKSADGIHFSAISNKPLLTKAPFDTLNLAFWDSLRGEYRMYLRDFIPNLGSGPYGLRSIKTATSPDFLNWSDPVWLKFPGAPHEHIYTNQIQPYDRAPHIFLGFPMRYHNPGWTEQSKALPGRENRERRATQYTRYGSAMTDGLFMSSRDAVTFKRWGEAIIRPGLRPKDNWVYGDNCTACGIVETKSPIDGAPNELSIYATESYWTGHSCQMRRYTYRVDGFVSVNAPLKGGEFVTKPLIFHGKTLAVNFSTSAAGSIRIEIQDADGKPIEGFAMADSTETYGDELERTVQWKSGADVSSLAGKPVRLHFVIKDADLFAFRFRK